MLEKTKPRITTTASHQYGSLTRLLKNKVFSKLDKISFGTLTINDPEGSYHFGIKKEGSENIHAKINVNDMDFYRSVAFGGALGAAESYIKNIWDSEDLLNLVRIMVRNESLLVNLETGLAWLHKPMALISHYLNKNSRSGSKNNIAAHYDLSNDLFAQFLDPEMMYSAAYFEANTTSLEEASIAKLERICKKLDLKKDDHVLEIGSGWGGFAIYAAKNYGCTVTTTTISEQQYSYAKTKIRESGLENKINLLKSDYRDLTGKYDKLVSIEMIEAVGADFLDKYTEKCSELLKEDGVFVLQAITINDQIYDRALQEVDFIKKYIFPGSFIPSTHAIIDSTKRSSDLRLYHFDDMSNHYARTLLEWRKRFLENRQNIMQLGKDEKFIRMWNYYFCYCAGGFIERSIGSVQMIFGKPLFRKEINQNNF
ncbi:MAG: class I SAM-dependent methyltransferase [Oligoflexales bacterium]|nr:class I SAM-dependent methyltransferase [Oligoflexales bacterium]